jgi:abortive infection bacteriophage resistance protein
MKLAKTIPELIASLKLRKLTFKDEVKAEYFLIHNSYHRLSGYWQKYQIDPYDGKSNFVDNTTFEQIVTIYKLDALLRNLLRAGIEVFEVSLRARFAYHMAHSQKRPFLSLNPNSYNHKTSKEESKALLEKIKKKLDYDKKDILIWEAIEKLSFGTVSKMYSSWTNEKVTKKITEDFKLFEDYDSTITIIHSLVDLRNACAHQERIWNRRLVIMVPDKEYLQKFGTSNERSQWKIISVLMALVDEIEPNTNYSQDVLNLCKPNEKFFKGLIELK